MPGLKSLNKMIVLSDLDNHRLIFGQLNLTVTAVELFRADPKFKQPTPACLLSGPHFYGFATRFFQIYTMMRKYRRALGQDQYRLTIFLLIIFPSNTTDM